MDKILKPNSGGGVQIIKAHKKIALGTGILLVILFAFIFKQTLVSSDTNTAQYQTSTAQLESITQTISASGTVRSGTNTIVTTQATGTVNAVRVAVGDHVQKGQTLATIALDQTGLQKQSLAYANYLLAKNQVTSAQSKLHSLQAQAFKANQTFMEGAILSSIASTDTVYIQQQANWKQAEADYINQSGVIAQAQASLTNSWYSYQQTLATITAPTSGIISNLIVSEGMVLTDTSDTSNATPKYDIATITQEDAKIQISVNLAETDVIQVKAGQKAMVSIDALPNKTFAATVLSVNTNGEVNSGVTTYVTTLALEKTQEPIYPNMAATAHIITQLRDNTIVIPSSAIQSAAESDVVYVIKDGKQTPVEVEVGISNGTRTEILSGITQGDEVVVSSLTPQTKTIQEKSVFSSMGGGPGMNAVRIIQK